MLGSKNFGNACNTLADEVANLARRLCTEAVDHSHLTTFLPNRLVPLKKDDSGVRPVGVGETIRRIIEKCISWTAKDIHAAGLLQTCTGLESGVEAAFRTIDCTMQEDWCEAAIFVDAENAFNKMNRAVALYNVGRLCPPLHQYLANSYSSPSNLYLADGSVLQSKEGTTQGDNLAMPWYAVASRPMIMTLKETVGEENFKQVWFADDSAGAGTLEKLLVWWEKLTEIGPSFGYHPKPSKSYLVIKDESKVDYARQLFDGQGIHITTEGKRHLGGFIGSRDAKANFVRQKVSKWASDVAELAEIGADQPQAALCGLNTGVSRRWKYLQRIMGDISHLFEPLEETIRTKFIPAVCGKAVSDVQRRILSLPCRLGGLGLENPVRSADFEFSLATEMSANLVNLILQQNMDTLPSRQDTAQSKANVKRRPSVSGGF